MGNHARARRLKVINWGKKASGPDAFILAMIGANPPTPTMTDFGIEDCIAISPDAGTSSPVSVLHAGPINDAGTNTEAYGVAAFIRNCFVDCGQASPFTLDLRALSMAWCKGGVI